MTITQFPLLQRLSPLVELQIHQVARKTFHYHDTAIFPYNLLISVLSGGQADGDFFQNCETGEKTHLRTNYAYLLPCHLPIRYERTPAYTVVTMRFNLTFFHGLDIFDGMRSIQEIRAPKFITLLNKILSQGDHDYIRDALTLNVETTRLCLSCWPDYLHKITPAMWKYEEILLYAKRHSDAKLTVAKLANIYGMRQDVFSRTFARDLGIPPKQYLADILVRKVSVYLLTTQMSIKEIANQLSFSSQYYLSRFFKKQTNLSPREYRGQLLKRQRNY